MGKGGDLGDSECAMVGACSISETADLGFSRAAISRVYRDWCEKRKKKSSEQQFFGRKCTISLGSWTISRQVCSNCVMLSCQPKSERNVSSTVLNQRHEG